MKKKIPNLLIFISLCFSIQISSQEIIAKKGSFGVDAKNKIIVWHIADLEVFKTDSKKSSVIKFTENFKLKDASTADLSYKKKFLVSNKEDFTLYITKLPLIHLTVNTSKIKSTFKKPGYFTFYNDNNYIETVTGIRHRGNLSLGFAKKSFDLEFWKDSINEQQKELKLIKGLRKDDDWILDAMFNEPLRLRSYIATKLWTKIHNPYYLEKEPKAKSGFRIKYVEVFKNNQYYGIYQLSESVDRKQLKLKKNTKKTVFGELYKANSYDGGPDFTKSPSTKDNSTMYWSGWATRFPSTNYQQNWKNLSELSNLVINSTDEDFVKKIESKIQIDNAIDYFLFVNLLRATDNLGKNYYLGKYNKDEPYFFIPWDLDGVWGIIQDGKTIRGTDKILDNGLFKRLIEKNPNDFKKKVKERWTALRLKEFSNKKLFSKINKIYNKLTDQKIYEREFLVWQNWLNKTSNEAHFKHLETWLTKRLAYLDAEFGKF